MTYYAVCNVNGPISVRIDSDSKAAALEAFAELDHRSAIDDATVDAEDDLSIAGERMDEYEFAEALKDSGATRVADLDECQNAHNGTTAHLLNGWMLWQVA